MVMAMAIVIVTVIMISTLISIYNKHIILSFTVLNSTTQIILIHNT